MDTSGIIVAVIIALGLTLAVLWKLEIWPFKKTKVYGTEQLTVKWPERFASYYYTPQGVNCNFEDTVSQEQFDRFAPIIDMGIRNLIKGLPDNWTKKRTHGEYIIGFIKPTAQNMDGSPALIINGIQSAGTVLGYDTAFSPVVICLPQQSDWQHLTYLMYSVWHEGEHDAELANDVNVFRAYIGSGDIHPHRPINDPEVPLAPQSLMTRKTEFKCGLKDSAGR